jgi:hypothetical protein
LILFLISQPVTQASIAIVEGLTGAGISGFIFAMFGYLLIADRQQTLWHTLTARKIYALFVGIMVVLAILFELIPISEFLGLGEFHVAHEAHLAGFLSGLLLGNFFLRRQTVWAGMGAAILPVLAVISLLYNPTSFWWQMARDHEKQVLLYQNLDLLSCEVPPSLATEERPKYSPVIINLERKRYDVVAINAGGTVQSSRLFIIDYNSLTVHNTYRTTAKYANLYDPSIGQLYEIRDDGGNCLGRFMPKHTDYNIIVFR